MTIAHRRPAIVLSLLIAATLCALGTLSACNERGARPVVSPEAQRLAHIDQPIGGPVGSMLEPVIGPVGTTHVDPPAAHQDDNGSSPGALPTSLMPVPPVDPEPTPAEERAEDAPPPVPAGPDNRPVSVAPVADDPNRPNPAGCLEVGTGESCAYPR